MVRLNFKTYDRVFFNKQVERLRQLGNGDFWLTVLIIVSQIVMKEDNVWKIVTEDVDITEK